MSQESLKGALLKTIAGVQKDPSMARVVFRAETCLEEGVRCNAQVRDFSPMLIDEPPELGGGNAAMNPVELVLVAFGTCQEIMYAAYAAVMGIHLDEVKVNLKGQLDLRGLFGLDEGIPAGFQKIQFETTIKSPADDATLIKLIETVEAHCPLMDILTRPMEVSGKAIINGQTEFTQKRLHSHAEPHSHQSYVHGGTAA